MKPHILIATLAGFAAAANKLLAGESSAHVLADVSLSPDGGLAALFVPDGDRPRNAPQTLMSVEVIQGKPSAVEKELAARVAENPYVRPLKLMLLQASAKQSSSSESGSDEAAPAKAKVERRVILIAGTYQP